MGLSEPFERYAWERLKRESPVLENSLWKHKSGSFYRIVTVANIEATRPGYPITVVYEDTHKIVWARPITNWFDSFTLAHRGVRSREHEVG